MSGPLQRLATLLGAELLRARLLDSGFPILAGRYRIEKVLGRGATGVVVRAFDARLAHAVALKLAPPASSNVSMLVEARALAHLRSHRYPGVVQVHEVGSGQIVGSTETADVDYVQMELIEGPSLRAWLLSSDPTRAGVLTAFAQLAEGLRCIHHHGIAHGDVKPDNAIVRGDGVPVLVDFAFAQPVYGQRRDASREIALGTAPYMAPEVWKGRARRKSDVYALAVSFWEIWTGALPFDGTGAPTRLFGGVALLRNETVVPEGLRTALKQAMHPRAGARPTAETLRNAFMEAAQSAVSAPRARRFWRRAVALLALASLAAWTYTGAGRRFIWSPVFLPADLVLHLEEEAHCRGRSFDSMELRLRDPDGSSLVVLGHPQKAKLEWLWRPRARITSSNRQCSIDVDYRWFDPASSVVRFRDGAQRSTTSVRSVTDLGESR